MKALFISSISALVLFVGCGPKPMFFWGNYSETLYDFKKNPSEKTLDVHKKSLLDIITESSKRNIMVPPGVYAEYGYLLLKEGKENEGLQYLSKEENLYPESTVFVQRLRDEYQRGKK
jgi:hypothetical protein